MTLRRVVLCELGHTGAAPAGLRAYVALRHAGSDDLDVLVRSASGQWLQTVAPLSQCRRFRVKGLGPKHPLFRDKRVCDDRNPEQLASELAAAAQRAQRVGTDETWLPPG